MLMCYQINESIIKGTFPATESQTIELGALLAQIEWGDCLEYEVSQAVQVHFIS